MCGLAYRHVLIGGCGELVPLSRGQSDQCTNFSTLHWADSRKYLARKRGKSWVARQTHKGARALLKHLHTRDAVAEPARAVSWPLQSLDWPGAA